MIPFLKVAMESLRDHLHVWERKASIFWLLTLRNLYSGSFLRSHPPLPLPHSSCLLSQKKNNWISCSTKAKKLSQFRKSNPSHTIPFSRVSIKTLYNIVASPSHGFAFKKPDQMAIAKETDQRIRMECCNLSDLGAY